MTNPVILQTAIVVKKTPVIEISPCLTQELVFAAADTIGELPRPASLVYIPLAIPVLIAVTTETMTVPETPPATAVGRNAALDLADRTDGIASALMTRMNIALPIYSSAIAGTTNSATFEIDFIPPIITKPVITATTSPIIHTGMPNRLFTVSVIELTCGKVPLPRSAVISPNTAKILASGIHFFPMPFCI